MQNAFSSTLFLTILLAIGLGFFLRAASKDRTTIVDVKSPLPPLEVLKGISFWLGERGWTKNGGNVEEKLLIFNGNVASSKFLVIFLSCLGGLGSACLGLVLIQLYPSLSWWPLLLAAIGAPLAGIVYRVKSQREESLEVKLLSPDLSDSTILRIKAHRDELIAIQLELSESLKLSSENSLLSSPI
ncbi:cofactor assembly of complex C subunit B [Prochlorococcus sp. MIT 1011]|uniref:cofactor assembly of complex C subunit B n=1 Tax=Prochlorococcus sp. MIT 1011 TaxID=3082520 RepID=UPI0039B4B625